MVCLVNNLAENQLARFKSDCKEIKENSKTTFVLIKNLEAALNGKTSIASQFLKVKEALDNGYSIIRKKMEKEKMNKYKKAKLKEELSSSKGDDASDETNKPLEVIKSLHYPNTSLIVSNKLQVKSL